MPGKRVPCSLLALWLVLGSGCSLTDASHDPGPASANPVWTSLASWWGPQEKFKPPPRPEEYTLPPQDDSRYTAPVEYPRGLLNNDLIKKPNGSNGPPDPSKFSPGASSGGGPPGGN
jgi:hypothetical protein